jgi:vitamin B12 transporter
LAFVPGLNVVQTGGPGGQTSISNHTKVLIDGIDVSDPSTPNRTFDFGQMLAMDIERVEVLRGPQSGLYGADALGGVILIYTKKGSGPPKATTLIEGGSFGTFNQTTSISGGTNKYNYSVNISHYRADAIPVTPNDLLLPGEERHSNRFDNWTYSAKLGVDVTKDVTVNLAVDDILGVVHEFLA